DVKRADVSWSSRQVLGYKRPLNQQVLIYDAGRRGPHRHALCLLAQSFVKIDATSTSKSFDRFAGARVERVEKVIKADEDSRAGIAVGPVSQPAITLLSRDFLAAVKVEVPQQLPCGCVQRDDSQTWRGRIQHTPDDDRVALHLR